MSWLKVASGLAPAALLLLVAIPSCSSDPVVPTPEVDEPTFVQEVAALVCKRRSECKCDTITPPPTTPLGGPECEAQVRQELSTTLLRPVGNEGLTFDGSCAALVLDEVNKQPGCTFSVRSLLQSTRCELGCSVLSGKARAGEACTVSNSTSFPFFSQCSGELSCNNSTCFDGCPGDPGEACNSPAVQYRGCQQGSFCNCSQGAAGQECVCSAGAAAGESCVNKNCGEGLLCGCPSGGFNCQYTQRVCLALPKVDEPCITQQCADGAFCDTQIPLPPPEAFVPTCRPLRPDGAACNSVLQCQSKFCPDGSCRSTPRQGEPCPGGLCGDGLACTEGVCVGAPGQLCFSL